MINDPEIRSLLTAALLNLDPRIVDKRIALNSLLVEVGLFSMHRASLIEDIRLEVDRIINQTGFLSIDECNQAIEDCIKRETVRRVDNTYILADDRKQTINEASIRADEIFLQVKTNLILQIENETGEPLDPGLGEMIFETVKRIITKEVYEFSLHLARDKMSLDDMVFKLEESEPITRIEEALGAQISVERQLLRKQIIGGIIDYFRRLPPELETMLRLLHHNVLLNQILNLDPGMVRLQKEWFSKRRIYLDTNVVLAYIFEAQKMHAIVEEVLKASLKFGIQLLISPATKEELKRQVQRAKKNYALIERPSIFRSLVIYGDDAILATFLKLRRNQPSLEWSAFISPFENLEDTLIQYDILVEDEGFEEAKASPNNEIIRKAIKDAKPSHATDSVIDHDTLNCSLILHLRDSYPPDERGQIVWLLTIDTSLRKAQKILFGSKDINHAYCVQASDWGEIVLPIQNIIGFVFKDFIGYLAQAKLGAIADPRIIQLDFLETIHDSAIDVERLWHLHPDQVRATLTTLQTNREARSLLVSAQRELPEDERKEYQLKFDELLDQAIEESDPVKQLQEKYDKKLSVFSKKLEVINQENIQLRETISKIESSPAYRFYNWLNRIFR